MSALAIYCADCGTECERTTGREAGAREPDVVDAQVWGCPLCLDAWAPCTADGSAIGLPAGAETRNARAVLRERQVDRLIAEALRASPNGRAIAQDRVASFLAHALRLPPEEAVLDRPNIEWCREAWRALNGVSYADVVRHAQTYRPTKPKGKAPKALPAPTDEERGAAAIAAVALRAALADPESWGPPFTVHMDLVHPRRGVWFTIWESLPGLSRANSIFQHVLLPGWQYTHAELLAEMVPDLKALAERGGRPTQATSQGVAA